MILGEVVSCLGEDVVLLFEVGSFLSVGGETFPSMGGTLSFSEILGIVTTLADFIRFDVRLTKGLAMLLSILIDTHDELKRITNTKAIMEYKSIPQKTFLPMEMYTNHNSTFLRTVLTKQKSRVESICIGKD